MSLTDFIGRRPWFIYRPAGLHVPPHGSVNCHVNFCRLMVFRAVAFALGALALLSAATPAEQLFHQAQKAERAGEIVRAYLLYAEAAAADPTNTDYWARAQRLRPAASLVDASPPKLPELSSDKIDRTLIGSITDEQLEQARALAPPAELDVQPGRRDYDFRGNSQALWEQLAAALNLKVLIDPEYRPTGPIRFQLSNADFHEVFRAMAAATDSFVIPISPRLFMVANDMLIKRNELEPTAAAMLSFPETLSVQEIQEVATSVRTVLNARKLLVDPSRHMILIVDQVTRLRLAEKLFADLMRPRAQVAVDVEMLTTDLSSTLSYGMSLPTSFGVASFINRANIKGYFPSGFTNFLAFGGGASLLGIGITNAQLFASVSKSNSKTIYHAQVTAVDGMPASLHVGEKYPIITNGYFGNTSGSGTVYTPPPTVNFEDLGLVLKVTPHVMQDNAVMMDVEAELKLLGPTTQDGIPIVFNTQYQSKVQVNQGEWAILSGLVTNREAKTITGLPILSAIPLLRENTITKEQGQTLIILKPHVTVPPPWQTPAGDAWAGTESRLPPEL